MSTRNHNAPKSPPSETPVKQVTSCGHHPVWDTPNDLNQGLGLLRLSTRRQDTAFVATGISSLIASCDGTPTTPMDLLQEPTRNRTVAPALTREALRQHDRRFTGRAGNDNQHAPANVGSVLNGGLPRRSNPGITSSRGHIGSSTTSGKPRTLAGSVMADPHGDLQYRVQHSGAQITTGQALFGIGAQFTSKKRIVNDLSEDLASRRGPANNHRNF